MEAAVEQVLRNLNPVDFGEAFFDTAVQKPFNALNELTGEHLTPLEIVDEKDDTLAAKAGNLAGFILDFAIISKITGSALEPLLGNAKLGVAGASIQSGVAGAIYGGVFTSSAPQKSLLQGRLENLAVSASTFAIMGGVGKALEGRQFFAPNTLRGEVLGNAIAGGAGGISEAFTNAGLKQHRLPTADEIIINAASYAAFGAGFGALHAGLEKISVYQKSDQTPMTIPTSTTSTPVFKGLNTNFTIKYFDGYQVMIREPGRISGAESGLFSVREQLHKDLRIQELSAREGPANKTEYAEVGAMPADISNPELRELAKQDKQGQISEIDAAKLSEAHQQNESMPAGQTLPKLLASTAGAALKGGLNTHYERNNRTYLLGQKDQ